MTTATHHDLISPRIDERLRRGELTEEQVDDFRDFLDRVDRDLLHHRIITDNAYTRWFREGRGDATPSWCTSSASFRCSRISSWWPHCCG